MKTLLTILFFVDTLVLIILSYILLRTLDQRGHGGVLTFLILACAFCIFLLAYLLIRYLNLPPDKKTQSSFD